MGIVYTLFLPFSKKFLVVCFYYSRKEISCLQSHQCMSAFIPQYMQFYRFSLSIIICIYNRISNIEQVSYQILHELNYIYHNEVFHSTNSMQSLTYKAITTSLKAIEARNLRVTSDFGNFNSLNSQHTISAVWQEKQINFIQKIIYELHQKKWKGVKEKGATRT